MASVVTTAKVSGPRVLVVDDEPAVAEAIGDVVGAAGVPCTLVFADSIRTARLALAGGRFDLLLTDLHLPDGDGMSLLPALQELAPGATAIVITGQATVDTAVSAIRHGAVDFMPKPFTGPQLVERVRAALGRQSDAARQAAKVARLRRAVRKLSEARRTVSQKVDLLCNDLVTAYGELSKQMSGVRTQEGFRKYIENAADLEQLLCHSMDWLLRQLGYANVGVWLAGEDGDFQLGAYMKYTTPGDLVLTEALKRVVLPMAGRDAFVKIDAADLKPHLSADEYRYLQNQQLVALNCTYLGESLASIVFFRDAQAPFKDEDADVMQAVGPIFAVALASVVHEPADDDGGANDADGGLDEPPSPKTGGPSDKKPRDKKPDAADWWKRGEAPPF